MMGTNNKTIPIHTTTPLEATAAGVPEINIPMRMPYIMIKAMSNSTIIPQTKKHVLV